MKILMTRSFEWWEIGLLKLCLISFGVILGLSFRDRLAGLMWLWWTIFVVIALYFMVRFFRGK